ncbi:MAG: hypothetical protein IT562_12850 [Alphaproteobacteria bacterium]|nr:hypothetical protein [Alphaproteobacteria bacterium]
MNWKLFAVAAVTGTSLLGAVPAFADPPRHARAYGWHAKHPHHRPRPVVVYAPPPVYYAPAPVYYAPPRVIYVPPPRPVIYGHIPVTPDLRVSIGLRL